MAHTVCVVLPVKSPLVVCGQQWLALCIKASAASEIKKRNHLQRQQEGGFALPAHEHAR